MECKRRVHSRYRDVSARKRSAFSPACSLSGGTMQVKAQQRDRGPRAKRAPSSKEGCLKCRVRKKKCDGRKPTCLGCERNHLLCNWPDPVCSTMPVTKTATSLASAECGFSLASEPDSTRPDERAPSLSNIDCNRSDGPKITDEFARGGQITIMLKDTKSLMLYEHWFGSTGNALSMLRGSRNAFITELPRLALYYPNTVMRSLLALSAIHYCNKTEDCQVQQLACIQLAQALQSLKYGITKYVSGVENDPLPLLVTTLILCFIETTRGDDKGNLVHHLRAARPLLLEILTRREFCLDDSILEFLKESYTYIACITDLTTNVDADIPNAQLLAKREPLISVKSPGLLLGCAYKLYELIPELSKIASQQRTLRSHTTSSSASSHDEANVAPVKGDYTPVWAQMDLQSRILDWEPPHGSNRDSVLCGRIYQQALLVYLDSLSPRFLHPPSFLPLSSAHESLDIVTTLLADLPLDAPSAATLIWPLAFLGTQANEWYHRNAILARLQAIWNNMAAVNVKATMLFLEKCWDADNRTVDRGIFALEDYMKLYGAQISFV